MKAGVFRRIPLVTRLTIAVVGLLTFGLFVGTASMVVFLQFRLVGQIDEQLTSTADTIGSVALETLTSDDEDSFALPSGHYIELHDAEYGDYVWLQDSTREEDGSPDLTEYTFPLVTDEVSNATTVPNTDGDAPWRVITIQTTHHGQPSGQMTIGLPLGDVQYTINLFLQRVLLVDMLVIMLGAIVGSLLVTRAMRPLRQIEAVAGRIAAGDLSQRVPQDMAPTTEVGSLAQSLNQMLSQVEQSFDHRRASEERMQRFVSDASHELRTPLATVRGYGELYRLGGIPDEEVPRAMGRVESEATRMTALVEDLVTLARLDEQRPMSPEEVELVVLAGDAAGDLRALDPSRAISVVGLTSTKVTAVWAWADSNQVRQVLANLIGNVVQHTAPGTPAEIAVGYKDGMAVIEVRDHGQGVPEKELERVFGRFYRRDISRSRVSGGTGLGLAIVEAIVTAHNGEASAHPTPGGGLTIRVTFPTVTRSPHSSLRDKFTRK